jgi:hypothetical protein
LLFCYQLALCQRLGFFFFFYEAARFFGAIALGTLARLADGGSAKIRPRFCLYKLDLGLVYFFFF